MMIGKFRDATISRCSLINFQKLLVMPHMSISTHRPLEERQNQGQILFEKKKKDLMEDHGSYVEVNSIY